MLSFRFILFFPSSKKATLAWRIAWMEVICQIWVAIIFRSNVASHGFHFCLFVSDFFLNDSTYAHNRTKRIIHSIGSYSPRRRAACVSIFAFEILKAINTFTLSVCLVSWGHFRTIKWPGFWRTQTLLTISLARRERKGVFQRLVHFLCCFGQPLM